MSVELIRVTRGMVQRYIACLIIYSFLLGLFSLRAEYKDGVVIEFTSWPQILWRLL